ncbi:MAG: hypothetical protein PHQ62_02390 [Clostridia bacterium]|nr:hypothetical protein [Clostridia bacterium]
MEFVVINLKEFSPTVELAIANLEIQLDLAKHTFTKGMKIIHGYGSHGKGGAIRLAVKKYLLTAKQRKIIKEIISGSEWSLQNQKTLSLAYNCPSCTNDEDLSKGNMGITVIVL